MGRSRGGFSTKVHALVDAQGRPLHIEITPGQQHDCTVAEAIIEKHSNVEAFVGDTGYDTDAIRECLRVRGIKAVIHCHPRRGKKPRLDRERYAQRYRVECFFHDLKRFRALASRFEKTARSYLAMLHLACSIIWLNNLAPDA